jgi:hypothetical protein
VNSAEDSAAKEQSKKAISQAKMKQSNIKAKGQSIRSTKSIRDFIVKMLISSIKATNQKQRSLVASIP